ncbi:C4-dicarboxylate ABC transporter [Photobacterium kishitanii]|uniref:C4-dicarboxylate ABC transporter n=1 Tax=Photobacterium kishitanii TaxID=318456 RepID=A0AAX0YT47_9GAMM|nr:TDT family transporter [Photobacterium kishitanii]KJG07305.1 C4-dicarboxylate ABC transporter [Photobacterium kishitanii]KJG55562.1 C4-dicarboxylate ABC transporter [Photobacterium kishitanii]KJG60115.1 C4-dicarboxylate ABC transporter [Photobacterium kishitanii]KJG63810.1 C4-dicarboxylate ABC transporter [Photobacterium kishitanii]KJG67063.1 C4-dicarboxylate ABC transporter [Photobacterium kishitanii]
MIAATKRKLAGAPTPMAGLALGIGSILWSWENGAQLHGYAQITGAVIAALMLLILIAKFLVHPKLLWGDLSHHVVGSVVPTFAMALMVVSKAVSVYGSITIGVYMWLFAVGLHAIFLGLFLFHRARDFHLHHMVPSWFVPPIGIIVADVSFPGVAALHPLAYGLLMFGMLAYAVMLPMMIYRFMFRDEVPDAAKPTIAIMAAPASLSLAGYLTITATPSPVIVAVLGGIAVLMTAVIYLAFFRLLRLEFSPGYAAFTFPMAIGATALFKTAAWMNNYGFDAHYVAQVHGLAMIELYVATIIIGYVAIRYLAFYRPVSRLFQRSEICPQNI